MSFTLILLFVVVIIKGNEDSDTTVLKEAPKGETMDQLRKRIDDASTKISARTDLSPDEKRIRLKEIMDQGVRQCKDNFLGSATNFGYDIWDRFFSTLSIDDLMKSYESFNWNNVADYARIRQDELRMGKGDHKQEDNL